MDQVHYMLVSTTVAILFGNGSDSTIEQSYLVVLDEDATQEQGMYQKIKQHSCTLTAWYQRFKEVTRLLSSSYTQQVVKCAIGKLLYGDDR